MKKFFLIPLIILCIFTIDCTAETKPFFPDPWFTAPLHALGEPSIYQQLKNKDIEVYRFTELPTWDNPIAVRIVITKDGTGILYAKMTDGEGGFDPGKISIDEEWKINKNLVKEFLNVIAVENFWQLPTNKEDEELITDGTEWILEGLSKGHYHLVLRNSPEESVRRIGSYFVKLSGLDKVRYDKAIADYNKAIEINPNLPDAHNYRGLAYYRKGHYDKAISDFNKAIELNPRDAEAYNNRGIAYVRKGQNDKAISDYTKAIEINPRDASAYYNRGHVFGLKEFFLENTTDYSSKAISDFTKVIEINPRDAKAYIARGLTYGVIKGQYDKAISDYTKAIEINPRDAKTYNNRGLAYAQKGQFEMACSDFKRACQIGESKKRDGYCK
jgi:tetratricopeptide (TPR) repeat protein